MNWYRTLAILLCFVAGVTFAGGTDFVPTQTSSGVTTFPSTGGSGDPFTAPGERSFGDIFETQWGPSWRCDGGRNDNQECDADDDCIDATCEINTAGGNTGYLPTQYRTYVNAAAGPAPPASGVGATRRLDSVLSGMAYNMIDENTAYDANQHSWATVVESDWRPGVTSFTWNAAAVNTANERITTGAPHGFPTGSGPVRLKCDTAAVLPTSTPQLALATDYFIIWSNAFTTSEFQLSATRNPLSAINLTAVGSGTCNVEYQRSVIEAYLKAWEPGGVPTHDLRYFFVDIDPVQRAMSFSIHHRDRDRNGNFGAGEQYIYFVNGGITIFGNTSPSAAIDIFPNAETQPTGYSTMQYWRTDPDYIRYLLMDRPSNSSAASFVWVTSGGGGYWLWPDDSTSGYDTPGSVGQVMRARTDTGGPPSESAGRAFVMESDRSTWGPAIWGVLDADGTCAAAGTVDQTPTCGQEVCSNAGMQCVNVIAFGTDGVPVLTRQACTDQPGAGINIAAFCN